MPPPLWMVTDGLRLVGPVTTTALVHHVTEGRVPEHCVVRSSTTREWRALDRIREVRAARDALYRRGQRTLREAALDSTQTLLRLSDGDEALELGLQAAALELGADVGFVHVFESSHRAVTRIAFGEGTNGRIGCPLRDADLLMHVARTHCLALGDAGAGHAFRVAASRLGGRMGGIRGVAMVPVIGRRGVAAMIELGRSDRIFRAADAGVLRRVAGSVVKRLVPR